MPTIGFSNRGRSHLVSAISSGSTTITLADLNMPPSGTEFDLAVENEYITVPAAANTGGPNYVGVTRGAYGTTAVAHAVLTPVVEVVTAYELGLFFQSGAALAASTGNFSGEVSATDFKASGVTGATSQTRLVGANASGPPVSGAHTQGDIATAYDGNLWYCTVSGTPGTWVQIGGPPSGSAGGSLTGTYPNPTIAAGAITDAMVASGAAIAKSKLASLDIVNADVDVAAAIAGSKITPAFTAEVSAPDVSVSGLTGAATLSRYVGRVDGGHPTTGTFSTGDWTIDATGPAIWVCTAGGSPGTWASLTGGLTSTLAADTDVNISSPANLDLLQFRTSDNKWHNEALIGAASGIASLDSGTKVPVAQLPLATSGAFGVSKPDGTTITIASGVISSVGGGGSSTLAGDTDVSVPSTPTSSLPLVFNTATGKWEQRPGFVSSCYAVEILRDRPVAYYRLGEASGTVAHDYSGNGVMGTYKTLAILGGRGATYPLDGGGALRCNNGWAFDADSSALPMGNSPRTMSVVFKNLMSAVAQNYPMLLSYGAADDVGGSPSSYQMSNLTLAPNDSNANHICFDTHGGQATFSIPNGGLNTDLEWHLFEVTWDGTTAIGYFDGQQMAAPTYVTWGTPNTQRYDSDDNLQIGDRTNGVGHTFDGYVCEAAIFDYVISATRARAHWEALIGFSTRHLSNLYLDVIAPPTQAPTVNAVLSGANDLTAGTYYGAYTFVTAQGETTPSPAGSAVLSGTGYLTFSNVQSGPPGTLYRKLYISLTNGSAGALYLVDTSWGGNVIPDNTTTTTGIIDGRLAGPVPAPTVNTAGGKLSITGPLSLNGSEGTSGYLASSQGAGQPAQWVATTSLGLATDPTTTQGDIIYRGASSLQRLAGGADGYALITHGASAPTWGAVMSNPLTTGGDILYYQAEIDTDRSSGKTVTVIDTFAGAAANITDENAATEWDSNTHHPGPWFYIDLTTAQQIDKFRLNQYNDASHNATQFKIESSPDATTWTLRHTSPTGQGGDTGIVALNTPASARYWRFTSLAGSSGAGWNVYDAYLYTITTAAGPSRLAGAAHGLLLSGGTSAPSWLTPGTSGYVLTSNGVSADPTWQAASGGGGTTSGVSINKVQLNYVAGDLTTTSGTALTAATWTDAVPNQSFTVDDAQSEVEIDVDGVVLVGFNPAGGYRSSSSRLIIDAGGTPITKYLGSGRNPQGDGANCLAGAGPVVLTGLSAGTHTVKLQIYMDGSNNGTWYAACASSPDTQHLNMTVIERKVFATSYASVNKIQLDYTRPDNLNPLALPDNTWTDATASQNFTVDDGQSTIEITADSYGLVQNTAYSAGFVSAVLVDSTRYLLGGVYMPSTTLNNQNPFDGAGPVLIQGLSAGTHTIKLQLKQMNPGGSGTNGAFYCRITTFPEEHLHIRVTERKVVPTGASGTLDQARYHQAASTGQTFSDGVTTIVNFDTQDWDTGASALVTTGASWKFTAVTPGKYRVKASVLFDSAAWSATQATYMQIFKNGSAYSVMFRDTADANVTKYMNLSGSDEVSLAVGDYIDIRVTQGSGGTRALFGSVQYNYVEVERIDGYAINPMTGANDLTIGGASGIPTRLAAPTTDGQALMRVSGNLAYALPPGTELAYVEATSSFSTSSTTNVDVTSMTATVTVPASGVYIEFFCAAADSLTTNGGRIVCVIYDTTAGAIIEESFILNYNTNGTPGFVKRRHNPGAGSRSYKVQMRVDSASGTGRLFADSIRPMWFRITTV